jgi:hypothetical protein
MNFSYFFYMLKIFKELLKGHKTTTTTTNLIIALIINLNKHIYKLLLFQVEVFFFFC